jgi:hypothetical protein
LFAQAADQAIEHLLRWRRDLNPGKTLVCAFLANAEFNGVKSGAPSHNLIENFRQRKGIDNVPAQFDRFRKHLRNLAKGHLYASVLRKLVRRSPWRAPVNPKLIREIRAIHGKIPRQLYGKTERARPVALSQSASRLAAKIKSPGQTAAASANPD